MDEEERSPSFPPETNLFPPALPSPLFPPPPPLTVSLSALMCHISLYTLSKMPPRSCCRPRSAPRTSIPSSKVFPPFLSPPSPASPSSF